MFAALSLGLHGSNVDRAFWSTVPGGVGKSLTSHLIASAFGRNHAWIVRNINLKDDEVRKQAEQLFNALVTTCQESPTTDRRMREDVHKRHVNGDPEACRMPYTK